MCIISHFPGRFHKGNRSGSRAIARYTSTGISVPRLRDMPLAGIVSGLLYLFVTSANLKEAALDRNIEVGLLVRDRALAATLSSHFRGLIDRELLRPLPMA